MKYWIVLLLIPSVLACVVPEDGLLIDESVEFCTDVYYVSDGIVVSGNDISINCNGAVLKSWSGGRGISIIESSNITISGCRLMHYNIGVYVENSTKVFLNDNHLVKNKVGTRFVNVADSATFNHDVSLQSAFEVLDSNNNVLSLTNKVVDGKFCSKNFCNERRNAVVLFVQPKLSVPQMHNWLLEQLGVKKNPERLKNWVFGIFN